MQSLVQDLRFALRQMRQAPGFAVVAILTLSLGIGSAAAVFSVLDAVLIKPLPYANQDRLVLPIMTSKRFGYFPMSYPSYLDERAQLRTFDAMAGYSMFGTLNLEGPSGAASLPAVKSTDNFFNVFGVKPLLGRTFLPGEDKPGHDDVVVLSYEVWQSHFGGQPDAVGRVVRLDGAPYTVIGVMPAGFRYPLEARNAIYTPLHANPEWLGRGAAWLRTVGRLKEGVSREQGQADLQRVMTDLAREYPSEAGHTGTLVPLSKAVNNLDQLGNHSLNGPLGTLSLAVLALLGIACVNVAGLLMARGVKREREVALRAAVGASRRRLVQQLVSESLVLSVFGLAGGVLVGWGVLRAMNVFLVGAMAHGADVHLNGTVVFVALVLALATSVLASLVPAARLSGTDPNRALRAGGAAGTGRGQHRLRSGFVVTQIALSLMLLVISGLLLRDLRETLKTDLGTDPNRILTTQIVLSKGQYAGRDPVVNFYEPLLEKISHLPGVQAAGVVSMLPIRSSGAYAGVHITGQPPYPPGSAYHAESRVVSAGYFDAIGMKLVNGRLLSPALDRPDGGGAHLVVNEAFEKKFFANGQSAIGAHLDNDPKLELKNSIVGVVTGVRQSLEEAPMPEMDSLMEQLPAKTRLNNVMAMALVVRASGDLQALTPLLRNAFHEVDPTIPFVETETMNEVVSDSLIFDRMEGWLFGIFAAFALLLTVIGLYGLINHEVELRTREIGIRIALGSSRGLVMQQVLRRVALLMVTGIGAGWLLTLAMKRGLAAVVEMHAGHDAGLLTAVTIGLAMVGVVASLLPARRAAMTEPMEALRSE
jgi:putative ABC transport system permease protein